VWYSWPWWDHVGCASHEKGTTTVSTPDAPNGQTYRSNDLDAILDNDHPLKRAAATWAAENLDDPDLEERDLNCVFWQDGWDRLAAAGHTAMFLDPAHGGGGLDLVSTLLTLEGLALACRDDGLMFALTTQTFTTQQTLSRFGSDEHKNDWLKRLGAGSSLGAFAMSEPESGSDAYSLTTTAERTNHGYVLNGEKAWVTMAPLADVFIVFATTDPTLGRWGISTFIIPAGTPGMEVGANIAKMGMRTTPFANVTLVDCAIPTSALLGDEGSGASIFSAAMETERGVMLIAGLGALERTLDEAVDYAKTREQFGQAIGSFQAVSHALSDVKLAHETSRLLLYKAAVLEESGKPSMMTAALAKLATSQSALLGALTSLEVHGAKGYVTEYGVERDLRNAAGGVIYGGASGIQKNIIARLLGLPA